MSKFLVPVVQVLNCLAMRRRSNAKRVSVFLAEALKAQRKALTRIVIITSEQSRASRIAASSLYMPIESKSLKPAASSARRTAKKKKRRPRATAAAATPSPPRKTSPVGDKVEHSPNSLAKCQVCHQKILQTQLRVGKEVFNDRYQRYYHQYHHQACFERLHQPLQLFSGRSVQDELAFEHKRRVEHQRLVQERTDLMEALHRLRAEFSKRLGRPAFMIFEDAVLRELVIHMPKDKEEILAINGIKTQRYKCFGEPILQVIRHFCAEYGRRSSTQDVKASSTSHRRTINLVDSEEDDEDGDEEVIIEGETLSCEEIVRRKFEHAAANNYLITVDI
jgi:superfamily II DNA helicase RecQ